MAARALPSSRSRGHRPRLRRRGSGLFCARFLTRDFFDTNGFGAAGVQVILTSETGEGLDAAALTLESQMRGIEGIADPRLATSPPSPELVVRPRPDEASRLGVSAEMIADTARVATTGDIDANVAKYDEGERRIPIRVRLPAADRANLSVIENLRLPTPSGAVTTLGSVADVPSRPAPPRSPGLPAGATSSSSPTPWAACKSATPRPRSTTCRL